MPNLGSANSRKRDPISLHTAFVHTYACKCIHAELSCCISAPWCLISVVYTLTFDCSDGD